jgi:tetratricopeptide (TPR) repeat protein
MSECVLILRKEIPAHDPERSELLLFYIGVLERNEAYEEALSKLTKYADSNEIVDKTRPLIIKSRLMRKLGRIDEASEHYKHLIARNPDCHDFYQLYLENQGLSLGKYTQ